MKIIQRYKNSYTCLLVICSALLQAFTLKAVLTPANLLPGGFLGIGVLVQHLTFGVLPFNIISWILNFGVALFCFKSISRRFSIWSMVQVTLGTIFTSLFNFQPIIDDIVLSVVVGGVLTGIYITLALEGNASTGGTDFIALYVSNKKGKAIWGYVFIFNSCLLLVFGAQQGWELAAYSILFQFIATKTIENFHNRYDQLTLQITTNIPEKVMDYYFTYHKHGMSCLEAIGGYTHRKTYILQTVISAYEVHDITTGIIETDPSAIINVMRTQQFIGSFYRKKQE